MTQSCPPQPQVSVIVPVYNQERYLEECISSIRRQTLAERECLIINDGSSDSSGEIARRFSEADSRIRYFEQKNRGVSSARNLGMRRASGRYLCFVDGDDFIDAAFLKHLLDASDRGASDLTVAGKLFCDRFPPDKIPALPTCGIFLRREFPLKNNLEFPEGIHPCEDGLFSHFVLALTEKISFCPEAVYHYRQHEQGNHHQIRKRTADILPMIPRWLSLIEEFYEQRHLWKRKAGHLVRFIEHEPFELRLLGMPFSPPEQEILYSIIRDFLTAHCTAAECRRASLHLPFRLLLQSSGFSDFGRRLRRAGKNTGIRRKLLHFCPVPSWRRNGRAQLRQVREQLEEIRRNITFYPLPLLEHGKRKIIVMRLFGGLGNQLFQYAFLFALSRQGGKARLEASSYEHDDKRVCELHHFRVSLPIEGGPPPWAFRKSRIPACLRSLFAAPKYPHFREEKRHGFDPGLAAPPRRHTYFKGYFQTEQYFLHCREQLCREFRLKTPLTPENARILEDIRSCCSISLHIRRTDYLSKPYLSPPPLEYYLRSMAEMEGRLRAAGAPQESLRYFIFSDDIEWARQNLRPALPHVHVDINDGGTGYFDLELMRNCRHHIIANSTFSWWAAWLNEHAEKIVIAPRIWFNREEGDRYHTDDALIPGSWLRI